MKRVLPEELYRWFPCSVVAVGCARGIRNKRELRASMPEGLHDDGYLSLECMNRYVRNYLPVVKKETFKKGERPILRDFMRGNDKKAIVCVKGHYIYIWNNKYYSFFFNGDDEVICVWWLRR